MNTMLISEYIIKKSYIKYEILDRLMEEFYIKHHQYRGRNFTLYIDLSSYIEHLFNPIIFMDQEPLRLITTIINLIGHMRQYYRSRFGLEIKVIVVFSKNRSAFHTLTDSTWNQKKDKLAKNEENNKAKILDIVIDQVQDIIAYIPQCYMVRVENEASGVIYSLIKKDKEKGNNSFNFILSRECNTFQIAALDNESFCLFKEATVYRYDAHIIDKDNVFVKYLYLNNKYDPIVFRDGVHVLIKLCKNISRTKFITSIMPSRMDRLIYETKSYLFPLFVALNGLPSRQVKAVCNWKTALDFLDYIMNDYNLTGFTNRDIYDALIQYSKVKKRRGLNIPFKEFDKKLNMVSIIYQAAIYDNSPESDMMYEIDLDNAQELKFLNDHLFREFPMRLNEL